MNNIVKQLVIMTANSRLQRITQ